MMISDIQAYENELYNELPARIARLTPDHTALWGQMDAQQMLEHLSDLINRSYTYEPVATYGDAERLAYRKMKFLEADLPFPKELRVPFLPEKPAPHHYESFELAQEALLEAILDFKDHVTAYPNMECAHPMFGPMNAAEWTILHARHIRHHLEQFGA